MEENTETNEEWQRGRGVEGGEEEVDQMGEGDRERSD